MGLLHEALKQESEAEVVEAITAQRFSAYARRAAFIWEKASEKQLALPWATVGGSYLPMFDPVDYYAGASWERNARLRVDFNGIGPYEYCPVVQRDEALHGEGEQILKQLEASATSPASADILDRVMGWAYLSETRHSMRSRTKCRHRARSRRSCRRWRICGIARRSTSPIWWGCRTW